MSERASYIINGRPYKPMAMYDAMEHVSNQLSKVRLLAVDLLKEIPHN